MGSGDTLGTVGYGAAAGGAAAIGVKSFLSAGRHRSAARAMFNSADDFARAASVADRAVAMGGKELARGAIEGAKRRR
jgi:hypothetical protein